MMTLNCYMLELLMVLDEENIVGDKVDCIIEFKEKLSNEDNPVSPVYIFPLTFSHLHFKQEIHPFFVLLVYICIRPKLQSHFMEIKEHLFMFQSQNY